MFQRDRRKQHKHVYSCLPFFLADVNLESSNGKLSLSIGIVGCLSFLLNLCRNSCKLARKQLGVLLKVLSSILHTE